MSEHPTHDDPTDLETALDVPLDSDLDPDLDADLEAALDADLEAAPDLPDAPAGMRLGFVRGISPTKWARRYIQAVHVKLQLVPVAAPFSPHTPRSDDYDMLLERTAPGTRPKGTEEGGERRALRLYSESIALVVNVDHELAEETEISLQDLALIPLLDHPNHAPQWPAAEPWLDPSWKPKHARAALELVATGAGAILLPLPLARHISSKKDHALLKVVGEPEIAGTTVWATWEAADDSDEMQQLAGILRGRTARSSREGSPAAAPKKAAPKVAPPQKKQPKLKPNSRGAQLAAAKAKIEREKAARRAEKKQKKRR